jgi:hypothetical protein
VFVSAADGAGTTPRADNPGLKYNPATGNLTVIGQTTGNVISGKFIGEASSALYADLAEIYAGDAVYDTGTVLVFGGDQEVTVSTTDNDTRVAGVVSDKPAYLMNSNMQTEFPTTVALQGRVPVKVVGPVGKGDLLVSATDGYAQVNNNAKPGTIIGKSIENFTATEQVSTATITVVVGKH